MIRLKKKYRRQNFWTRAVIIVVAIVSVVALTLRILDSETNASETFYQIVFFSITVVALLIAVIQGIENSRTTQKLDDMVEKIHRSIDHLESLGVDTNDIMFQLAENNVLEHRILQTLEDDVTSVAHSALIAKVGKRRSRRK